MWRFTTLAIAMALFFLSSGVPTQAQEQACGERASVVAMLSNEYGEEPRFVGMISDTKIIEVFVSDQTRTWTALMTSAEGISCLLAAGIEWHMLFDQSSLIMDHGRLGEGRGGARAAGSDG